MHGHLLCAAGGRRQNPIRADQLRCATGVSMFGLLDYRWPHSRVHSPRREDDREERGHTERDERPDEEERSAGLGDVAADADTLPHHVDDGDDQSEERPEEDDDVPRSPFGEQQRSVQPDDQD